MISHLKLRLAASALTLAIVLHGHPAAAAPAPAVAQTAAVQLPHIAIVSLGKGTPVVLIPGLSSPRAVWDETARHLAQSHEVLLVQVNGFAGDAPGDNLKPGLLAGAVADLHAYLTRRKLTQTAVVGHSLGGLLTLMLAKAHPADVGKAMIVDALPFVGTIFAPGATVASVEPQARALRDGMAASYGQPPNLAYVEGTANRLALTPSARAKVKAWMLAADPRVSAQALYEDMTTDMTADLPTMKVPLTVIVPHGGMLSEEQAKGLYTSAYAKAPRVTIKTVADSAHFVMLDQPAAFGAALDAFLAS